MISNNRNIKKILASFLILQMFLLLGIGGHFAPETECCHTKMIDQSENEMSCCSSANHSDPVSTCNSIDENSIESNCGCIHNSDTPDVDFKPVEIKTDFHSPFIATVVLHQEEFNTSSDLVTITSASNLVYHNTIYLKNLALII